NHYSIISPRLITGISGKKKEISNIQLRSLTTENKEITTSKARITKKYVLSTVDKVINWARQGSIWPM
ncbi:19501_t:CDS:2, partial [Entrophospora sp. SA101]